MAKFPAESWLVIGLRCDEFLVGFTMLDSLLAKLPAYSLPGGSLTDSWPRESLAYFGASIGLHESSDFAST